MDTTQAGDFLAAVNASLNATSALALATGFVFIKRKVVDRHRRAMMTAVGASALFLVFYVAVDLSVLFSHMVLAVFVLPFVLRLIWLARKERFAEHRRLARFVFPVWAYVSITGLLVYILLYQVYGYA
jgi:uncharacterized membrane protein YozB (DUF420 family)